MKSEGASPSMDGHSTIIASTRATRQPRTSGHIGGH
jgi:hypothetical protein